MSGIERRFYTLATLANLGQQVISLPKDDRKLGMVLSVTGLAEVGRVSYPLPP
jgi:hypothetical protein